VAYESKADRDERIRRNLAVAEGKIFLEMVRTARGNSRVLTNVTAAHESLGLPASWMRERMAGRIRVKPVDLEILERLLSVAKSGKMEGGRTPPGDTANLELVKYRAAIGKFCRGCAPEPENDRDEQLCPDSICPLRSVSPLALSPKAYGSPVVGKDWGR